MGTDGVRTIPETIAPTWGAPTIGAPFAAAPAFSGSITTMAAPTIGATVAAAPTVIGAPAFGGSMSYAAPTMTTLPAPVSTGFAGAPVATGFVGGLPGTTTMPFG